MQKNRSKFEKETGNIVLMRWQFLPQPDGRGLGATPER